MTFGENTFARVVESTEQLMHCSAVIGMKIHHSNSQFFLRHNTKLSHKREVEMILKRGVEISTIFRF